MSWAPALGAVAALGGGLLLGGCGSGGRKQPSGLAWQGRPALYIPATIPGDRILSGTVRNTGTAPLTVKVPDVRLFDGDGHRVGASAQFIRTFAHGLIFPDTERRDEQPVVEQRRIGQQVLLKAGASAPLVVTWHAPRSGGAARVDYGAGSLPVPEDSTASRTRG